uniref:Uncharacterized protein n=1 Tax=Anguilla anguilla TaxID=7936 RepID=A0A0E9S243_ANGAN
MMDLTFSHSTTSLVAFSKHTPFVMRTCKERNVPTVALARYRL